MKKYLIVLVVCLTILICGCESGNSSIENSENDFNESYIIDGETAKEKVKMGATIVDVRTVEEYNEGHIDGAILFTVSSINEDSAIKYLPDKDAEIIVYCRSGNRSNQALQILKSLGYNNVYDLGAIDNWEE